MPNATKQPYAAVLFDFGGTLAQVTPYWEYLYERACNEFGCGDWSEVWYLDVGRLADDVNGDGYGDLIIGVDSEAGGPLEVGEAFIAFGRPGNGAVTITRLDDPRDDVDGRFGRTVAMVGDINADGCDELVHTTLESTTITALPSQAPGLCAQAEQALPIARAPSSEETSPAPILRDLTSDGQLELIVAGRGDGGLRPGLRLRRRRRGRLGRRRAGAEPRLERDESEHAEGEEHRPRPKQHESAHGSLRRGHSWPRPG